MFVFTSLFSPFPTPSPLLSARKNETLNPLSPFSAGSEVTCFGATHAEEFQRDSPVEGWWTLSYSEGLTRVFGFRLLLRVFIDRTRLPFIFPSLRINVTRSPKE